jgi:hypothetical protein
LVETGLAKHDFPPYGCGSLHTPQYAVRREVPHLLFKKPPLVREGEPGRAVVAQVVFAASPGRDDGRTRTGTARREGVCDATRLASPQRTLLSWTPQDACILSRPTPPRRAAGKRVPRPPWLLCA